jgi:predicted ArsR family transcriptional regulator
MNAEEKEERKKKVLAFACKAHFPVTPSEVSDELGLNAQTAIALLFELVFEKHLQFVTRGCHRYFFPVPDKELTIINQKE